MIAFLHPAFTIVMIILIIYTFLEVYNDKKYSSLSVVAFIMVLLLGFRIAGADYPIYEDMYEYIAKNFSYNEIWIKAKFGESDLNIEWIYSLLNKIMYDANFPFFIFTFILAFLTIFLKYFTFKTNVVYPSIAMLVYMIPNYFTADGGHMRQGMAMTLSIVSFYFIKKRQLLGFLFIIYIALGFHNSSITFIFAYWLVLIPLNSKRILLLVLFCIALSPFKIYEHISILDSLNEVEIYAGFKAHVDADNINSGRISFADLICIMQLYYIITFNKEACSKIPYYEYMRNLVVIGICLYFIFRGNPIFSTRLTAHYISIILMIYPNIIGAIENIKVKRILHFSIVSFVIFYYFIYAKMQAPGVRYDFNYNNYLFFWQ